MSLTCMVQRGIDDRIPGPAAMAAGSRPPSEDLVPNPRHMRQPRISRTAGLSFAAAALTALAFVDGPHAASASTAPKLRIEEVGSDSTSFDVVATIVAGPTEALLFDAQYHVADARRLADRIAASGKHLKAIFLSHPDHDHFAGAATIVERFPGTPVYMTPKGLEAYKRTAATDFRNEKSRTPQLLADSIVTPIPLPSNKLTIDGETIEIIPDLTGDVISGVNSIAWIPSIGTVLAGDVLFNSVHAWLGSSDTTSRQAWRKSLARISALHPKVVVAGHKKDVALPDTPNVVDVMDRYLADFDSLRKVVPNPPALYQAMMTRYPNHAVANLLRFGAMQAYGGARPPAAFDDAAIREQLTAVNKAWSAVRLSFDSAAADRMLTPDFFVLLNGRRVSRSEFIGMVAQRQPGVRLARFDNPILSITKDPAKEEYTAAVMEKIEYERAREGGAGVDKMYSLWITRDTYRRVGSGWQFVSSEGISSQNWLGQKPPFADW